MLRLDTWKQCVIDDVRHVWSNTYYLDGGYLYSMQHDEKGGFGPSSFIFYESNLHQNIVSYPLVTAYDVDGDLMNGSAMWSRDGNQHGYWDHPGGMAPWDIVKRCAFYTPTGRPRQLYLRASLGINDIAYTERGHLTLPTIKSWDLGFQDTVAHWFAVWPRTSFYVRHNTRGLFGPTYVNPVKWAVTGASELHAIDRRAATYMGNGRDLFERCVDVVAESAHQWGIWWPVQFYHAEPVYGHIYFIPARASIGNMKAMVGEIKGHFQSSQGGESGQGNVPRWAPFAEDIVSTCATLEQNLTNRLDDLDNIEWTGDPSNLHCSDSDYHKIMQAVWDTAKEVAWLPSLDFKTPNQDH